MYDPLVGRFLEDDPIEFTADDPNLYRYVGNHPTNATDPSGLAEKDTYFKLEKSPQPGKFGGFSSASAAGWKITIPDVSAQYLKDGIVSFSFNLIAEKPNTPPGKGGVTFRPVILNRVDKYGLLADGTQGPLLFEDKDGKKPTIIPASPFTPGAMDSQATGETDYVIDFIRDRTFLDVNGLFRKQAGKDRELVPELIPAFTQGGKKPPANNELVRDQIPCRFPIQAINPASALFIKPGQNGSDDYQVVTGKDNAKWAIFVESVKKTFCFIPDKNPGQMKQAAELISKEDYFNLMNGVESNANRKTMAVLEYTYVYIDRSLVAKIGIEKVQEYIQGIGLPESQEKEVLDLLVKSKETKFADQEGDKDVVERLFLPGKTFP